MRLQLNSTSVRIHQTKSEHLYSQANKPSLTILYYAIRQMRQAHGFCLESKRQMVVEISAIGELS